MKMPNYTKSLFLLFLPIISFAQLEKIYPGMPLDTFHNRFHLANCDYSTSTLKIISNDTLNGGVGISTYSIFSDEVNQYDFLSEFVEGPCKKFQSVDSSGLTKLLYSAKMISAELINLIGVPDSSFSQSIMNPVISRFEISLFFARWKISKNGKTEGYIDVQVKEAGDPAPLKWAETTSYKNNNSQACFYAMTILGIGTKACNGIVFGIGDSKVHFLKVHPYLKNQWKDFPQVWTIDDAKTKSYGSFTFLNGRLVKFSYSDYRGYAYGDIDDAKSYAEMRDYLYDYSVYGNNFLGRPDSSSSSAQEKYLPRASDQNYSTRIFYSARWSSTNEVARVQFLEAGGGQLGPVVFQIFFDYEEKK